MFCVVWGSTIGRCQTSEHEVPAAPHASPLPTGKVEGEIPDTSDSPKWEKMISFQRFESPLVQVCAELERDGRRERLTTIALERGKTETACTSCRSLWRTIGTACKRAAPPVPKRNSRKHKEKDAEEHSAEGSEQGAEGEGEVTPTPTPKPIIHQRYPSPAALDLVSQVATGMYEMDTKEEKVLKTLSAVRDHFFKEELTNGEKDYFDTLFTYLTAPWEGRVEEAQKKHEEQKVDDLFEW